MPAPRLLLLAVDDLRGASTRYRVAAHEAALRAAGYRTELRTPRRGPVRVVSRFMDLVADARLGAEERLLFIHRKLYPPIFARRLRRRGRLIFLDFDDAIDLPPPGAVVSARKLARYGRNFRATVAIADHVICGNRELATRVSHPRVHILPTPVDTERFRPGAVARGDGRTLGWVGHSDNLRYLEALAPALREVARIEPLVRLIVVCDRAPEIAGLRVEYRPWTLESELSCFGGIDIGLMPLDDTPWTRSKCAFKALQYMALGLPTIASPVGMNRDVIEDGVSGRLAADGAEWATSIRQMLADPVLAGRIGQAGRAAVVERYSLSTISGHLLAILGEATEARVASGL